MAEQESDTSEAPAVDAPTPDAPTPAALTSSTPGPATPAPPTPVPDTEQPATPDQPANSEDAAIPVPSAVPPNQIASMHRPKMMFASPLRGTHDSLIRQNEKSEADDLERIEDDADLHDRINRGMLVPVPASEGLTVNSNLPQDRRYCRPWTATFLTDLARAHLAQFHSSFEVSSAVRTVEYQKRLIEINGNAAAAEGDIVSPHVTGATIDIAKQGMSRRELEWMRDHLLSLQNAGQIDVEEEFRQACFHITVYKSYVPSLPAHKPHRRASSPSSPGHDTPSSTGEIASRGR